MQKTVLVPVADGSEEIESVCIIDVLRRAGASVTVASVDALQITASRGVRITADCLIKDCVDKHFDLIALPGGMPGAQRLRECQTLIQLLKEQMAQQRWIAAICAAPAVVLLPEGLLKDRSATAHPSVSGRLENQDRVSERVVVDGNIITSRGPGTTIEFALICVKLLFGESKAGEIAQAMLA